MKQLISLMAMILITRNGSTTNLDIKNALRFQFSDPNSPNYDPNFRLVQRDVHEAMSEISKEQGLEYTLGTSSDGHEYRIWSLPQPAGIPQATDATDTQDSDDDVLKSGSTLFATADGMLVSNAAPVVAQASPGTTYPAGFGRQLDPALGSLVGYMKQDPSTVLQGDDRNTVKRETYKNFKVYHQGCSTDDVRICSVDHYNKKLAGKL